MNSVTLIGHRNDDIRAYTLTGRYVALLVTMDGRTGAWGRWYPTQQEAGWYLEMEAEHLDASGWKMDDPIFRDLAHADIAVLMMLDPVKTSYPNPGLRDLMMGVT